MFSLAGATAIWDHDREFQAAQPQAWLFHILTKTPEGPAWQQAMALKF